MIKLLRAFVFAALCMATSAGSAGNRSPYQGSNIGANFGPYLPLGINQNQQANRQVNPILANTAQTGRFVSNLGPAVPRAEYSLARAKDQARFNEEVAAAEIREEISSLFDIQEVNEQFGASAAAEQAAATQMAVEFAAESAVANKGTVQIGAQQNTAQTDQARLNEQVLAAEIREEIGSLFDIQDSLYGPQRTAQQSATNQIAVELAAESAVVNQRAMQMGAQQQSAQSATWQQQQQVAAQAAARQQQQQQQAAWQQQQVAAQAAARQQQQAAVARQQQQQAAATRQQQQQAAAARQQQQQAAAAWQQQQQVAAQTSTNTVTQTQSRPGIIGLVLPGQRSNSVSQTTSVNQARQQYYQPANSIGPARLGQNQYQTRLDQSNLATEFGGSRAYQPGMGQSVSQASSSAASLSNSEGGRSKIVVYESNTGSNQAPIVEVVSAGQFGPVVEVIDSEKAGNNRNFAQQNRIAENILYQGIGVIDNLGL